jgi:phosphomannomutase
MGIVVDPDVDRLALIDEKGEMFGEEYTLVAVADYLLKNKKGCYFQSFFKPCFERCCEKSGFRIFCKCCRRSECS